MGHQTNHTRIDPTFTALREEIIFFAEATTKGEPGECAFDDPTTRKDTSEAFRALKKRPINLFARKDPHAARERRMTNHLNRPSQMFFNPLLPTPAVCLIDPSMGNAGKLLFHSLEHQRNGFPILQVRRMHFEPHD